MNQNIKIRDILKLSISKPSQYISLLGVNLRKVLLAILIAAMIPGIISGVSKAILIQEGIDLVIDVLEEKENAFEIKDGILNFEKEEVTVEDLNSIIYINTNKELKDINSLRSIIVHKDIYSAILKDGISFQYLDQKGEVKYSDVLKDKTIIKLLGSNESLNNKTIINVLQIVQNLKYLIIIAEVIGIFVSMIIDSFMIYVLGSLICKMKKIIIPSLQLYKMSIFALILPTILQVNSTIGFYSIIIGGIYMSIAINSIKNTLIKSKL